MLQLCFAVRAKAFKGARNQLKIWGGQTDKITVRFIVKKKSGQTPGKEKGNSERGKGLARPVTA